MAQCAKSRSCHFCIMIHGRVGSGMGRLSICLSSGCMGENRLQVTRKRLQGCSARRDLEDSEHLAILAIGATIIAAWFTCLIDISSVCLVLSFSCSVPCSL